MSAELLVRRFAQVTETPNAIARLRRFLIDLAVSGRLGDDRDKPIRIGWPYAPLGDLVDLRYGKGLAQADRTPEGPVAVYGSNGIVARTHTALADAPSIIVGRKGSAGALRMADEPSWTTDVAYYIEPPPSLDIRFLFFALQSLRLESLGKGVKPGLSRSDAYPLLLPQPPLTDQRRIVAKVDELMALCDELEAAQTHREARRDRLRATSLRNLVAPEEPKENARCFLRHSARMIIRPEHVADVRQAIQDLAVGGWLVPQDPEDGSRTTMSLGEACQKITDGTHRTPTYVSSGTPFISVKDFSAGQLSFASTRYITPTEHSVLVRRCDPRRGDVLIGRIGTLGKAVVVDTDKEFSLFVSVGLLRPKRAIASPEYLKLYLNSSVAHAEYDRIKVGAGTHTNKLNLGDLKTIAVTLPPLKEQHRIVAKVDELMAVCDELEQSLAAEQTERARLLEALLHDALEDALPARELELLGAR